MSVTTSKMRLVPLDYEGISKGNITRLLTTPIETWCYNNLYDQHTDIFIYTYIYICVIHTYIIYNMYV
jgi:hypothetical protein